MTTKMMARDGSVPSHSGRWRILLARLGVGGFLFFLIKGLAWLVVPAILLASQ